MIVWRALLVRLFDSDAEAARAGQAACPAGGPMAAPDAVFEGALAGATGAGAAVEPALAQELAPQAANARHRADRGDFTATGSIGCDACSVHRTGRA